MPGQLSMSRCLAFLVLSQSTAPRGPRGHALAFGVCSGVGPVVAVEASALPGLQ